jgi:bifunctional non-homologous end joining protein LigD
VRLARTPRIPKDATSLVLDVDGREVRLTNLQKPFWTKPLVTKGDLLRYYLAISPALLPHLRDRAMVMKRYPDGAAGPFFFMKRAPTPRPEWLRTCPIEHAAKGIIDFPVIDGLAALLWVVNLGCIDLNPWYARCDDTDRPDYLHFDLDPVPPADFDRVRRVALFVRESLEGLGIRSFAKTTGSRGIHVYVPIERGPTQKEVWTFAKALALFVAAERPDEITAEYRIAKRPAGRVLVDYNQNAWGRTLASVYSVRPKEIPTVSAPVTWDEVRRGARMESFTLASMPARIARRGDLWAPLLAKRGRVRLDRVIRGLAKAG